MEAIPYVNYLLREHTRSMTHSEGEVMKRKQIGLLMILFGTSCSEPSQEETAPVVDDTVGGEDTATTGDDTVGEPCETRGTWMWASSIETEERMESVFQELAAANINTVYMSTPQINGNHGYGDEATFLEFITRARAQGMNVQAWIANGHRLGRDVTVEFIDVAEQDAQVQWVTDIMEQYGDDLDGVHLDYIRYHTSLYEINEEGRMDAVTETVRRIHDVMQTQYSGKSLTAAVFSTGPTGLEDYQDQPEWTEDVPQWFRDWYDDNPGSTYHGPDEVSIPRQMFWQQNAIGWLEESIIDAVMPMQYTNSDEDWQATLEENAAFATYVGSDNTTRVQMGLGWKDQDSGFDAAGVVRKIKHGRSVGSKGTAIFILGAAGVDDTELIEALSVDSETNAFDAPYEDPIVWCPIL